jgi:dihydroflavonol-4-reductase
MREAVSGGQSPKVLVTGASGLIGSHVVEELARSGYEPRGFSRRRPLTDIDWVAGDVRDAAALRRAMGGCEAVIHTAAVYSYARARAGEMTQTNVAGTELVLEQAARAGVGRVVVTSSCATCGPVAGRPATETDRPPAWELSVPYKRTKIAAEAAALARAAAGQDVVVVNPTTTIGPQDTGPTPSGAMVRNLMTRRMRGFIASGGLNLVSAPDVARGHVLALRHGRRGERYLLGGENLTMKRMFSLAADLAGVPRPRLAVPYRVALAAAWTADRAARRGLRPEPSLLILDEVRLARLPMYFSTAKAERELGYHHGTAAQALADTIRWFGGPCAR